MHEMQRWFIEQINGFLIANGRQLIGWDEISEGGLPDNTTVMWWRGWEPGPGIAKQTVAAGHDLVAGPTSHLYFDHYQSNNKENEPMAWGGCSPLEKVYSFEPVLESLDEKEAAHILGAQGQLWTEYMPDMKQVEYMAFPRACALAELAWLPKSQKDYDSFLERMKVQVQRFDMSGIKYRNIE